jgi:hypothetical protein
VIIRDEFGPPLSRRTALAVAGGLLVLIGVALLVRGDDGNEAFVHKGEPAFTLEYQTDRVRPVEPQPGELARFEARRGPFSVTLVLRPVEFPGRPFSELPVAASLYADDLRRDGPPALDVRAEGRTRVNRQPGYELNYRFGPPHRRSFGRDVLLFPDETDLRGGVVFSMRSSKSGSPVEEADRELAKAVRRAAHSLQFE